MKTITFRTQFDNFVFNTSGNMMLKFQVKAYPFFVSVSKIYDRNLLDVSVWSEDKNFLINFRLGKFKIVFGKAVDPRKDEVDSS